MNKTIINIYTDGACSGNPGFGGWAAVLNYKGHLKEISGGVNNATNNQMELKSVIEGLKAVNKPSVICIHSDSAYIVNAINQNWVKKWQTNGWQTTTGPLKNKEYWQELLALLALHTVTFTKVKGHSGHLENERADVLAVEARLKLAHELSR